jgi:Predicted hydrolases of the HAD superfamily
MLEQVGNYKMLSEYKYSIAMGNAADHVKRLARYVTLDTNKPPKNTRCAG